MRSPLFLLSAHRARSAPRRQCAAGAALSRPSRTSPRPRASIRSWCAEFGGAETGARAAYVEGIGRRVAAFSGTANAGQAYRFTTLNSAVENAFSVPGGYVYITRQLMGLMNDEAELAFVARP